MYLDMSDAVAIFVDGFCCRGVATVLADDDGEQTSRWSVAVRV